MTDKKTKSLISFRNDFSSCGIKNSSNKELEMGTVKRVTMKLGETVFPIAGARPLIRRDSKLMDGGLGATPGTICGLDYMRDPKLNKGSSFTIEERQTLGIHGLLPPR